VLPEPVGGAHRDPDAVAAELRRAVARHLPPLLTLTPSQLVDRRLRKFRGMGVFREGAA
jgi:acetyl-CoA carboxylase carboxyl transferase subunit alpha